MKAIVVTSNTLRRNKLIVLFSAIAVIVCFAVLSIKVANAQEATDSAKKFNITFPIPQLGNCESKEDCREYCEDIENRDACISFAKQRGFYKTSQNQNKLNLEKAKEALGCNSKESCKAFCSLEENREKCSEFAKLNGLRGGMIREGTGSGQIKPFNGLKEGTRSGEKFTPESNRAWERANENARFCREYPDRCKNASGSAEALKDNNELKREIQKKEFELKKEKEKRQFELRKKEDENQWELEKKELEIKEEETEDEDVKGVSKTSSFFDWLFNVFLK